MTITPSDINSIVNALQESDWDEAVVSVGDVKISVARNGARLNHDAAQPASAPAPAAVLAAPALPPAAAPAPAPAPASAGPAAPAVVDPSDVLVTAPSVGVFWSAPEPGAAAFVELGSRVEADHTVCIVEIMKLMNNVAAGVAGTVTAVHVENGQAVEFGTPLFSIRPDAN